MKQRHSISLEGIKTYAYHGVLPEERKIGTYFITDISVDYDWSKAGHTDNLDDTINYAAICDIVRSEMAVTSNLIENVAQRIVDRIHAEFSEITAIKIKLRKMSPPVECELHCSAVALEVLY